MKTCEQVTAEVLARRDAYLAAREAKKRAVRRYAAAGLLVFAAVFAAAGLFRSGWLGSVPPVSLPEGVSSGNTAEAPEPSGDLTVTAAPEADAEKGSAGAAVTTARAVPDAATGVDLSPGGSAYLMIPAPTLPTAERPTEPAQADAPKPAPLPESTAPATEQKEERQPTTTRRTETPTAPTTRRTEWPTALPVPWPDPPTERSPAPTRPTTEEPTTRRGPETEDPAASPEPATEDQTWPSHPGNSDADPYSSHPAGEDQPGTEPSTQPQPGNTAASQEPEALPVALYVLYNGAVYAAEGVLPQPLPAGATALAQKDAVAEGLTLADVALVGALNGDLLSGKVGLASSETPSSPEEWEQWGVEAVRINLLSLPRPFPENRLGVNVEGTDQMFVLEYVGPLEDLT